MLGLLLLRGEELVAITIEGPPPSDTVREGAAAQVSCCCQLNLPLPSTYFCPPPPFHSPTTFPGITMQAGPGRGMPAGRGMPVAAPGQAPAVRVDSLAGCIHRACSAHCSSLHSCLRRV